MDLWSYTSIMKKTILITLLLILPALVVISPAGAMMHEKGGHMRDGRGQMHPGMGHMHKYGGYSKSERRGWYGARRTVSTVKEARSLLEEFLKDSGLVVKEIRDEGTFYAADIKDKKGEDVDILIIHKRTCRIRSAF